MYYEERAFGYREILSTVPLLLIGEGKKLNPVWVGPFLVDKKLSSVLFDIRDRKKSQIVHHDRLKHCRDRFVPFWLKRLRHEFLQLDSQLESEEEDEEPEEVESFSKTFFDMVGNGVLQDSCPLEDSDEDEHTLRVDLNPGVTRGERLIRHPRYLQDFDLD